MYIPVLTLILQLFYTARRNIPICFTVNYSLFTAIIIFTGLHKYTIPVNDIGLVQLTVSIFQICQYSEKKK